MKMTTYLKTKKNESFKIFLLYFSKYNFVTQFENK